MSFHNIFNLSVLQLWEEQTRLNINTYKNNKLVFLLNSEKENGISMFNRHSFLASELFKTKELDNLKFDSLIVIELNKSGEANQYIKYVLAPCTETRNTTIIKFQLQQGKWKLGSICEVKTEKISDAVKVLIDRDENGIYWGQNINDLVSVSKFLVNNEIKVEVFASLTKKQYESLGIIENCK